MANEITVSASVRVTKGGLTDQFIKNGLLVDMTGNLSDKSVQTIGHAAHEAVSLSSDIGTPGWSAFLNLDDTNFVQIGIEVSATFYPLVKLMPGEMALFRLATDTFYAQADTADVNLQKFIIEE